MKPSIQNGADEENNKGNKRRPENIRRYPKAADIQPTRCFIGKVSMIDYVRLPCLTSFVDKHGPDKVATPDRIQETPMNRSSLRRGLYCGSVEGNEDEDAFPFGAPEASPTVERVRGGRGTAARRGVATRLRTKAPPAKKEEIEDDGDD